ncbi:MAG: fructose-6-phosphate aldolase [Caldisericales bacterium]|nr:fructose-6-phosphate aldolase [Caldisericales bacterium]
MQIFLDTASVEEIKKALSFGVVSGVTTNPTLMSRESGASFKDIILKIAGMVPGPVSAEVTAHDAKGMISQAMEIVGWSDSDDFRDRITIKVPMTSEGTSAIKELSSRGISTNCTLVFTPVQAMLACEAGATFISPFVGRIDDSGLDGTAVLKDIVSMVRTNGYVSQIIAASIRHPAHVYGAAMLGCDIATIPLVVLEQCFKNPLTDIGIRKFDEDWKKFQASQAPKA